MMTSREPAASPAWAASGDGSAPLAQMLDALPSAIAFWDRELHNMFANRAFLEWYGQTPDRLRGEHLRVILGAERFDSSLPYLRRALAGEPQVFARAQPTPTGGTREAQIECIPYLIDGEVAGVITVVVDVSQRLRAERAARAAAEQVATLTERARIEERAHEGILQDLFAVQLRIEHARAAVSEESPAAGALDAALERLDVAVADLRLVLSSDLRHGRARDGSQAAFAIATGSG